MSRHFDSPGFNHPDSDAPLYIHQLGVNYPDGIGSITPRGPAEYESELAKRRYAQWRQAQGDAAEIDGDGRGLLMLLLVAALCGGVILLALLCNGVVGPW